MRPGESASLPSHFTRSAFSRCTQLLKTNNSCSGAVSSCGRSCRYLRLSTGGCIREKSVLLAGLEGGGTFCLGTARCVVGQQAVLLATDTVGVHPSRQWIGRIRIWWLRRWPMVRKVHGICRNAGVLRFDREYNETGCGTGEHQPRNHPPTGHTSADYGTHRHFSSLSSSIAPHRGAFSINILHVILGSDS